MGSTGRDPRTWLVAGHLGKRARRADTVARNRCNAHARRFVECDFCLPIDARYDCRVSAARGEALAPEQCSLHRIDERRLRSLVDLVPHEKASVSRASKGWIV